MAGHAGEVHQLPADHAVAQTVVVAESHLAMDAGGFELVIQPEIAVLVVSETVELPLEEPVAQDQCTGTEH